MVDLQSVVYIVLYLLVAGLVFGLLFFLIDYIARQFPSEPMALCAKIAKVILVVLGILVLIGFLLQLLGGPALFRWGPPTVHP